MKPYLLIILLTLCVTVSFGQSNKLALTLSVKDTLNKRPKNEQDWFTVDFSCTIKNTSLDTLYIVNPNAYKIFPHPWIISINGIDASFWSGSMLCAPPFTEDDVIRLSPNDTINRKFEWHSFINNFSRKAGTYKAKVRYAYLSNNTKIYGLVKRSPSDLRSAYSNEVLFKIAK